MYTYIHTYIYISIHIYMYVCVCTVGPNVRVARILGALGKGGGATFCLKYAHRRRGFIPQRLQIPYYWVAVKELNLSCHSSDTILFGIYP